MNKTFFTLIALCYSLTSLGQDSIIIVTKEPGPIRKYVPLESITQAGNILTRKDSLNFQVVDNDTLVLLHPGIRFPEGQGVLVPYVPKDSLFLETYEDVVYGETEAPGSTLKLWKDDIKIYFDSSVPASHQEYLLDFAAVLSSGIDSLNISEARSEKMANYRVYYRKDSSAVPHEPRIRNTVGGFYVNWNEDQELERGIIQLNTYNIPNEASAINLLGWYFFKSLGYFSSSSLLPPESYLSTSPIPGPVSEIDREILNYHYSYSNCIGFDRESFNCFHEKIREKLKETPYLKISVSHQ